MKISRRKFIPLKNSRGFTLIEVIVVAGIIAILAGILVPLIFKEIDESKISRAAADVRSISSAMLVLRKDTCQWPGETCTPATTLLTGSAGNTPAIGAVVGWDTSVIAVYEDYINVDINACWPGTWLGPYMAMVSPDPWGNAYVTNADAFRTAGAAVWILSAGPNGVIESNTAASAPSQDDIGVRLR